MPSLLRGPLSNPNRLQVSTYFAFEQRIRSRALGVGNQLSLSPFSRSKTGGETDEGYHVQASQVCRADRRRRAVMRYCKRRILSSPSFFLPLRRRSHRNPPPPRRPMSATTHNSIRVSGGRSSTIRPEKRPAPSSSIRRIRSFITFSVMARRSVTASVSAAKVSPGRA